QVSAACLRHDHDIFQTDSAQALIVQTRFDSDHISVPQNVFAALTEGGRLMDFESKAMPCSMKESLHPSIHRARWESFACEIVHDLPMNVIRARAIFHPVKGDVLAFEDAMICMLQPFRSAAANNRSSDVAEIPGVPRAWKNIHDDGFIRTDGAAALIVRVHA